MTQEHKCNGARLSYHTSCTCGWYSMDYDASTYPHPRAEAYKAWREHVTEAHAKVETQGTTSNDK